VNDNLNPLDRIIERSFLSDSLRQNESLDLAGISAAILLAPAVRLLLLAKGKADGVTKVEELKGDGGANEARGAGDDDGSGLAEGGGRHVGRVWKGGRV
jgi:hypothetical protein